MRQKFSHNKIARLFVGGGLLIACWTVMLPALSERPAMRQRLDRRNEQGINAGAMFYSELNAMPQVMERLDRIHAVHGNVFWQRSVANSQP
jgi:hypothetical protein